VKRLKQPPMHLRERMDKSRSGSCMKPSANSGRIAGGVSSPVQNITATFSTLKASLIFRASTTCEIATVFAAECSTAPSTIAAQEGTIECDTYMCDNELLV
jgi:hypothetical protein